MSKTDSVKKLLPDFMVSIKPFLLLFGVFDNSKNEMAVAREFINRFYGNLVSLENDLLLKDSLSAALTQRYNHEMFLDFFYIFGSQLTEERCHEFFSYEEKLKTQPDLQTWRSKETLKKEELRKFIPPWVSNDEALKKVYKRLSDMAHPNLISMRLNRRGQEFEFIIITDAIAFAIINITTCFLHSPFWKLVYNDNFDMPNFGEKMREFQMHAWKILLDEK